jgi:hypothetical protein
MNPTNYNQVFSFFNLKPTFEASFCNTFQYLKKYFVLFKPSESEGISCLFLNALTLYSPKEVFISLSDSLLISKEDISFDDIPEIGLSFEPISQNKLVNFLYNFVQIRDVVWSDEAKNIFMMDCFENVFSNSKNSDLSLLLSDEKSSMCDVIDFNNTSFNSRFEHNKGIWTSKYFSNMKEAVISFNPFCLVNFYTDNLAVDYFSVILNSNQNLNLQSSAFEILLRYPFSCYNVLYTPKTNELYSILDLIVFYGKFYWGIDMFLRKNSHTFTLAFTFNLEANLIQYIQFTSNVQAYYRKIISSDKEDAENIVKIFPLNITNTFIENRKIYTLEGPDKVECYEAVIHNLLKLMNKATLFNLICCK